MGTRRPAWAAARSRGVALLFGALAAAALWIAVGGMIVDGGGEDWLHYEVAPVPEMDDILDPGAATFGSLAEKLIAKGYAPDSSLTADQQRRALIGPLQALVEGERLDGELVPAFAPYGFPGGTDSLDDRDRARWNRQLVDASFPGLLPPMRQSRISFLLLAGISGIVLLGLTYVCLAGAWQFTLSVRWLGILVLAGLLALLFQGGARHDLTPYRQLADEGRGWGIFPLIPYGPNEQGFGPRLPPAWVTPGAAVHAGDIASWEQLAALPDAPESAAARAVAGALERALPGWKAQSADSAGREAVLAAINSVLREDVLFDGKAAGEDIAAELAADSALRPYFAAARAGGGAGLSPEQRERMNRLILDRALPGAVRPAIATRWKNPAQMPGLHLFGTDESGRDVLARLIHGARVSLSVGFVSVFLSTVIGLVMGSLAAYYGGKVDMAISRFLEIMMCFPSFFLILAVIAVLDRRSIVNIMLVIGLTSWTGVARLIRGEMLRQKKMDYVSASVALGASDTRTIFRQILPNAMAPVLVSISFGITGAILTEAGLSFIGFGVTPPTPTWGQLLSEGRDSPLANWWLAVFPGIVLFISVLAYNMVGEGLRDALDPRSE